MNNRKIIVFILISFGISWSIWLPNVLSHNFQIGWEHSDWLHILGGLGPFLGVIITTFIFDNSQGVKDLGNMGVGSTIGWIIIRH